MNLNNVSLLGLITVTILLGCLGLQVPMAFADGCPEQVGRWTYGPASDVAASGNLVFYSSGAILKIADASDSTAPQVVGELEFPGTIGYIAYSDGYAYVLVYKNGLRIIDVSTPATPVEVGFFEPPTGDFWQVAVSGDYAYASHNELGVLILDVRSPENPTEAGIYQPSEGYIYDITVSGDHVYGLNPELGLQIVDVSTPESPIGVGVYQPSTGYIRSMAVSGEHAYVSTSEPVLQVVDVSTPATPVEVGSHQPEGTLRNLVVSGDFAYAIDGGRYGSAGDLVVIDISTPASPSQVGLHASWIMSYGLAAANDLVYSAAAASGLQIFDVSTPSSPTEVSVLETPGSAYAIATSGDLTYVGEDGHFRIFDSSTPSSPVEIGALSGVGRSEAVVVSGSYAYLATWGGLRIIDISDPTSPTEVGLYYPDASTYGVAIVGDYAHVVGHHIGLRIVDISTPSSPTEVGILDSPFSTYDVTVVGNFAYVAGYDVSLRIIDVSTPTAPIQVGAIVETPGLSVGVAVTGDKAFLVDRRNGREERESSLRIIDISTPSMPEEVGTYQGGLLEAVDVAVSRGHAYVADQMTGMHVVDVKTPSAPVQVGLYDRGGLGSPSTVTISREDVYLTNNNAGFLVFRNCVAAPTQCTPIYVAAAASGAGAGDSMWATDLGINNGGVDPLAYRFRFLPRRDDNTAVGFTEEATLQSDSNANFENIWRLYTGDDGAGAIEVCVSNPDAAGVISRTYNTSEVGTFGQSIVGIEGTNPTKMIATGEKVRLGFLTQNSSFRTNVGFMNAGATTITINAEFFESDGTSLGTSSIGLPPYSNNQWNRAFRQVTTDDVDLGYIDVWSVTEGAMFLTYASVVDAATDDPTTIWPFDTTGMVGGGEFDCTPIWVAAAASVDGASGTVWATDLGINNLTSDTLTYRFQFLPRGGDNSDATMGDAFNLVGNASVAYSDIWMSMNGRQGAGAINVCVDNGDAAGIISRTYNSGDEGTFGQSIVGMRGAAPAKIGVGEKARLGYLFQNDAYRTNIGFMNAGSTQITITGEFFDMQGNSLGTKNVTLPPYANTQWNKAYTLAPISADDITAGFVDVWTDTEDGAFLAYASIVDSGTGDPTTVWPF